MKLTSDLIRATAEQLDLIVIPGEESRLTVEFNGREDFDLMRQVIGYRAAVRIGENERRHGKRQ